MAQEPRKKPDTRNGLRKLTDEDLEQLVPDWNEEDTWRQIEAVLDARDLVSNNGNPSDEGADPDNR